MAARSWTILPYMAIVKTYKIFSSKNVRPIFTLFCRNVHWVTLYQIPSSHVNWSKDMPARGQGCLKISFLPNGSGAILDLLGLLFTHVLRQTIAVWSIHLIDNSEAIFVFKGFLVARSLTQLAGY